LSHFIDNFKMNFGGENLRKINLIAKECTF